MGQLTNVLRQEKIWERQRKRNQRGERNPSEGGGERTPQKRWYPLSQPGYQNQRCQQLKFPKDSFCKGEQFPLRDFWAHHQTPPFLVLPSHPLCRAFKSPQTQQFATSGVSLQTCSTAFPSRQRHLSTTTSTEPQLRLKDSTAREIIRIIIGHGTFAK